MVFFGWSHRRKTRQLDQTHMLVLTYRIFHVMWLFQVAWDLRYFIATATQTGWDTQPLTPYQAQSIQPEKLLPLNFWWRWGLLIAPAVAIAVMMVRALVLKS